MEGCERSVEGDEVEGDELFELGERRAGWSSRERGCWVGFGLRVVGNESYFYQKVTEWKELAQDLGWRQVN